MGKLSGKTWADRRNYDRVAFAKLARMPCAKRVKHIERVFRDAKVSRPARKAELLSRNVNLLLSKGWCDLSAARKAALSRKGTAAKIEFMKQFHGIGDKYARDIWMGVYHRDFRGSIAIDARIKALSRLLGCQFRTYAGEEQFYQRIARDAGRDPWEVDRLIYDFKEQLIERIGGGGPKSGCPKRRGGS